ncbi:holin [Plesiomonas shigelloides]|uniref:phage holin family protein n=1 Tax=Plesiomonas shigelloides TaxID=703 RepID=UPI0012618E16|nr:phage holin family protein [Plesiomonas shigelloides]KAB7715708.1 holin [Plesiomonas shigelloides]
MQDHERLLATLATIGAISALGKALASAEPVTWRILLGRTLAGSALSMSAAALLFQYPTMSPIALVGIGAALGVAGEQCLEIILRRWLANRSGDKSS